MGNGFATASGPGTPRTLAPPANQPDCCFTVSLPESNRHFGTATYALVIRTTDCCPVLLLPPPIRAVGPHEEPWSSSDRNSPATGAWRTSPPLHPIERTRLCASTQQTYGSKPRSEDIYARVVPEPSTLSEAKPPARGRPMAQPNAKAKWRRNFQPGEPK